MLHGFQPAIFDDTGGQLIPSTSATLDPTRLRVSKSLNLEGLEVEKHATSGTQPGNLLYSSGKSPFLMGQSTINGSFP